jgi:hypothetical protein
MLLYTPATQLVAPKLPSLQPINRRVQMIVVTSTTNPKTSPAAVRNQSVKAPNNQRYFVPTDMTSDLSRQI